MEIFTEVKYHCVIVLSCRVSESRLKDALMTWYHLHEVQHNLQRIIAQQQHQLDCLDVATDFVTLSAADATDTISDLQVTSLPLLCFLYFFLCIMMCWAFVIKRSEVQLPVGTLLCNNLR